MVMYECKLYNYSSKIKTQYKRHLETKKHGRNEEKSALKSKKEQKKSKKEQKRAKRAKKEQNLIKPFKCESCPKSFTTFANKRNMSYIIVIR